MEMPKEINGIPVLEFTIDKMDYSYGIQFMSLVDEPAVEKVFIALGKQHTEVKLAVNDEKRIVTGVAMRTNFPIYRVDESGKPYYLYVTPEELELMVEKFMAEKKTDMVNLQHDPHQQVKDVFLMESFILKEAHKPIYPEFDDVEEGSWMVTYKVKNDEVWKQVKEGKLRGFSVEMLGDISASLSKEDGNTELLNLLTILIINESKT